MCGLIAASDLILYLSRKDKKYSTQLTELVPKTDYIFLQDYKQFVLAFDALYIQLEWYLPKSLNKNMTKTMPHTP
jgi:hypothetical protein